jgi:hypothetical protein
MTSKGKTLPKDVIECWPEVFGEVKLNVLPLKYLHAVKITFKDGKIWEIKVTSKTKNGDWETFEKSLSEMVKVYERRIESVDFKLDTDRVKKDIKQITDKFLRKKKL